MNTYTNQNVADMTVKQVVENFGLTSKQNGWRYNFIAKTACDAGKRDETFVAPKRRETDKAVSEKPAAKDKPNAIKLDAKTELVLKLTCINASVDFTMANVKNLLETAIPAEIAMLSAEQLDNAKQWAGVETTEQRIEAYEKSLFEAVNKLALALDMREVLIARNIAVDSGEQSIIAIFKRLSEIVLTDDEIAGICILSDDSDCF